MENKAPDALLRNVIYLVMSALQPEGWEDWETEIQKDVKLSSLMQDLLVDSKALAK